MNIEKVKEICELAMVDKDFREQFMRNPHQAVEDRGLHFSPEEMAAMLCLGEDDCAKPREISENFSEPQRCMPNAGLGCEPRKHEHPAGPRC